MKWSSLSDKSEQSSLPDTEGRVRSQKPRVNNKTRSYDGSLYKGSSRLGLLITLCSICIVRSSASISTAKLTSSVVESPCPDIISRRCWHFGAVGLGGLRVRIVHMRCTPVVHSLTIAQGWNHLSLVAVSNYSHHGVRARSLQAVCAQSEPNARSGYWVAFCASGRHCCGLDCLQQVH